MGEIICKKCRHMNWHIRVHTTGICENCYKKISFCDSCMVNIKSPEKGAVDFLDNPRRIIKKVKKVKGGKK